MAGTNQARELQPELGQTLSWCSGNRNCYSWGCRCAGGRAAEAAYQRERRLKQRVDIALKAARNNPLLSEMTPEEMMVAGVIAGLDIGMPSRYNRGMTEIDTDNLPRYCIWNRKKCRVLSYEGDGWFRILDTQDNTRRLHRAQITFVKEAKK